MGVARGVVGWKRKGGAQTRDTTPTPPLKRRGLEVGNTLPIFPFVSSAVERLVMAQKCLDLGLS